MVFLKKLRNVLWLPLMALMLLGTALPGTAASAYSAPKTVLVLGDSLSAEYGLARGAGARVLLVGMRMPPNYGRDYADKFFAMFGTLSKDVKAPLAPFMLDGVAEKSELFQADRLHPLAAAHPIILGNIWPHLQPLLKAK